jgi:hypothetical protein
MSTQYLEEAAVVAGFQLGYECMDISWMMVCVSNIACLRMHAFASVKRNTVSVAFNSSEFF